MFVKSAIEGRESITVVAGGISLRGTYHGAPVGSSHAANQPRIGILFLNPGVLPRAATGDSAVYWADSFAKFGYPSFRIDLPGFGDSDGDLPREVLEFQHRVNVGSYAPLVSEITQDLRKRFDIAGWVAFGHCSGAISALHAAPATANLRGLILLDPYFHHQQSISNRNVLSLWHMRVVRGLEQASDGDARIRRRGIEFTLLSSLSRAYDALKYLYGLFGRGGLPGTANLPVIRCWNQVVKTHPMLVLRAPSPKPKKAEFDYFRYLQNRLPRTHRLTVYNVEGTDHSFAEGPGKEEVRKSVERWLQTWVPLVEESSIGRLRDRERIF